MQNAIELLESIIDLHSGEIAPEDWLQTMCGIFGCSATAAVSWPKGFSHQFIVRTSAVTTDFKQEWVADIDALINGPRQICGKLIRDEITSSGTKLDTALAPFNDARMMIGCVDTADNCTLLVLRRAPDEPEWNDSDQEEFRQVLPVLTKAQTMHKMVVNLGYRINMARRILNGAPRGIVSMTPYGKILRTNTMAADLLREPNTFSDQDSKFIIKHRKTMEQFEEKLNYIRQLPLAELEQFIWNRSFATVDHVIYQIVMRAYPFDGWALEASPHDRFVSVAINAPENSTLPSEENLQDFYDVSSAQARVLACLLKGHGIKKIAEELSLSVYTVRSHLQSVHNKLDVSNQTDLMRLMGATLVNYQSSHSTDNRDED
jgi:DNA-binding CsgD family transcriptional regulator